MTDKRSRRPGKFTEALTLRFEPGQLELIQKAADIAQIPRERFMRNTLVSTAKQVINFTKEKGPNDA